MERPADLFDRSREWTALAEFVEQPGAGLRVGVVSGRRRQGKSFLLRRIARAQEGLYHQAQELERGQALDRFGDDVARALGLPAGQLRFPDWEAALRTALGYPARGSAEAPATAPSGPGRVLVLDELPYLLGHSPEIPSVVQELVDEARDLSLPPARIIVCGSALSVMTELLSGTQPLRGRAHLDLTVLPFDYRTTAEYWGVSDPQLAFLLHTVFGGTAGYRPLVDEAPASVRQFGAWLGRNVLNPAHALYGEKDYLLREDTRITDKQLYNAIIASVAAGNHAPKDIGRPLGRDTNQLRHPLGILVAAGFLTKVDDMLAVRRPLYFLADPIVRFTEVVIEPYRPLLEEGAATEVWKLADSQVRAQVYGPHFEHLAREFTAHRAGDLFGTRIGDVGPGTVNDPDARTQHELDVVATPQGATSHGDSAPILMLGEAKATNRRPGLPDLARLDHIRDLLVARGHDATDARLALFSRDGFDGALVRRASTRSDVHLITLDDMYA